MKSTTPYSPLWLIAGLSALIYLLVFSLPFPLTRLYTTIPPVDYAKLTGHSPAGFVAYVAGLATLFGLYLWAIQLTAPQPGLRSPVSGRFVWLAGAVMAVVLLFSYPLTAIDLFIYAIRSRGWALYSLNPLATAPAQFPSGDPWLGLAAEWVDAPSPYGPVWEWLSLGAFHLSGGDFLAHLFALKVVAILAYLGCAWLVYLILRQTRPEWATAGTIAFAWNPLALLESAQNGHNDIVMAFFLLAAIWMMTQRMSEWRMANGEKIPLIRHSPFAHSLVCLFLALSILVKFVTALVVPFFLLALVADRPNWAARFGWLVGYGFLILGFVFVGLWPLWPGWDNWAVLQAGGQAGRSLLALLVLSFRNVIGLGWAFDVSSYLLLAIFAVIYLYWFIKAVLLIISPAPLLPHSPALVPIAASFFVLFWYVLLAAPVFHAWYLLWFLPLAPLLLPNRRPLNAAIVFSITALLMIPYFETIRVWYPVLLANQWLGHAVGVPLLVIPPVLALFWPLKPLFRTRHLP